MTFAIDTGEAVAPLPIPQAACVDDTQSIRFISFERADRTKRKIIEAMLSIETVKDLDEYFTAEDLMIDALHLFDDRMSAEIKAEYDEHRAHLKHGAAPESSNVLGKAF